MKTFKIKLKEMRCNIQNIISANLFIVLIITFGCNSCGGVRDKMKDNTTVNSKIQISEPDQNPLIFPPDFPKMNNMPDHIPNGEIIEDIISYEPLVKVFHLFDTDGKYLGKRENSDFPEISKINALRNDIIDNDSLLTVTDQNRVKIFNSLNELGFKIPKSVNKQATLLRFLGGGMGTLFDFNIMKSSGFIVGISVYVYDKDNCTIGQYNITHIFNYKGELERTLDFPSLGEDYQFTSNRNICFSTFRISNCGYEPDITIDHHRFSNFKLGYTYDFDPIDEDLFPQEFSYSSPNIILKDSLIQLIYDNAERFLRVIVEPYEKKIYYKMYDTRKELDGKYNQYKFHESLMNFKLPDGSPEHYKSYEILVPKK